MAAMLHLRPDHHEPPFAAGPIRRWSTRSGVAIICFLALLAGSSASAVQPLPRSVLILDQFEVASPFSAAILSKFRSTLQSNSVRPVSIYIENLDLGRFCGAEFERVLQGYFREKYRDKPIGIVVTIGSASLELASHLHAQLWSDVPVIFASVDESMLDELELPANVTGTTVRLSLHDAVSMARPLVPNLKRIAIVGDPPERQFIRRRVEAQVKSLANEFELINLTGLTMRDLRQRVSSLPDDSAIIYIGLTKDADQVAYTSHDAVAAVAAVANRPIIVQAGTHLGTGVLGGIVANPGSIGYETAKLALRVLAGESVSDIPVMTGSFMRPVFDWRELQRWNIGEAKLPPGSEIWFRRPAMWDQYRAQILAACTMFLFQAALIGWLLFEHRRRHSAEIAVRHSMSELSHMNRLATAGELSASIAHEVNQPLTGIVTRANAALRWLGPEVPDLDRARAALRQIVSAGHRASEIVAGVRSLFRRDANEKVPVDINKLILTVLRIARIDLRKHAIELQTQLDEHLPAVSGNPVQLQQVILNLVVNAIESMHATRTRVLRVKSELAGPDAVRVSIEDTGTGVDPSNLRSIFKPMFTTKTRGMGMGLAICCSIIEGHNGQIWASPGSKGGSIFQFELPTLGEQD